MPSSTSYFPVPHQVFFDHFPLTLGFWDDSYSPFSLSPLFHPHPQLALLQVSKASPTFHVSKFTSLKLLRCFLAPALSTQTEIPPCKAALPFCSLAPLTKSQKVLNTPVLGMPDIKFSSLFFPSPPPCNEDIPRVIVSPLMASDSQV